MIKKVSIPLGQQDQVSAKISVPADFSPGRDPGIILAHGAGNDLENPLLVFLAEGLARAGVLALRFNFPYMEAGRTAPDKPEVLEATWEAAFTFLTHHPSIPPGFHRGRRKIHGRSDRFPGGCFRAASGPGSYLLRLPAPPAGPSGKTPGRPSVFPLDPDVLL